MSIVILMQCFDIFVYLHTFSRTVNKQTLKKEIVHIANNVCVFTPLNILKHQYSPEIEVEIFMSQGSKGLFDFFQILIIASITGQFRGVCLP